MPPPPLGSRCRSLSLRCPARRQRSGGGRGRRRRRRGCPAREYPAPRPGAAAAGGDALPSPPPSPAAQPSPAPPADPALPTRSPSPSPSARSPCMDPEHPPSRTAPPTRAEPRGGWRALPVPVCLSARPCVRLPPVTGPVCERWGGGMLRGDRAAGRGDPEHRAGRGNSPPHPPRGGQGSCQEEEEEEDGEGEGGGHPPAAGPAAPGFAQPGAGVAGRISPRRPPRLSRTHRWVPGRCRSIPAAARPGRAPCPCSCPGTVRRVPSLARARGSAEPGSGSAGARGGCLRSGQPRAAVPAGFSSSGTAGGWLRDLPRGCRERGCPQKGRDMRVSPNTSPSRARRRGMPPLGAGLGGRGMERDSAATAPCAGHRASPGTQRLPGKLPLPAASMRLLWHGSMALFKKLNKTCEASGRDSPAARGVHSPPDASPAPSVEMLIPCHAG